METKGQVPILIPVEQDTFWNQIRTIIREEIARVEKDQSGKNNIYRTEGLVQKPLYKMTEVCQMFDVTRPTVYDWIKHGKLRPFKVRSRVYFLFSDIQQLLGG